MFPLGDSDLMYTTSELPISMSPIRSSLFPSSQLVETFKASYLETVQAAQDLVWGLKSIKCQAHSPFSASVPPSASAAI